METRRSLRDYTPAQLSKSKRDTGLKVAQLGGALGARFGPHGLIVGTIAGFALGLLVDEILDS